MPQINVRDNRVTQGDARLGAQSVGASEGKVTEAMADQWNSFLAANRDTAPGDHIHAWGTQQLIAAGELSRQSALWVGRQAVTAYEMSKEHAPAAKEWVQAQALATYDLTRHYVPVAGAWIGQKAVVGRDVTVQYAPIAGNWIRATSCYSACVSSDDIEVHGEESEVEDAIAYSAVNCSSNAPCVSGGQAANDADKRARAAAAGRALLGESFRLTLRSDGAADQKVDNDHEEAIVSESMKALVAALASVDQQRMSFAEEIHGDPTGGEATTEIEDPAAAETVMMMEPASPESFLLMEPAAADTMPGTACTTGADEPDQFFETPVPAFEGGDEQVSSQEQTQHERRWAHVAAAVLEQQFHQQDDATTSRNENDDLHRGVSTAATSELGDDMCCDDQPTGSGGDMCCVKAREDIDPMHALEEVATTCATSELGEVAQQRPQEGVTCTTSEFENTEEARTARELAGRNRLVQDQKKVQSFLTSRGYSGVNAKRRAGLKSKYPLHSAVKENNSELVGLLLNFGANRFLKNSTGQMPLQLAQKSNSDGSHAGVIAALT
jgi:hypothetical protein